MCVICVLKVTIVLLIKENYIVYWEVSTAKQHKTAQAIFL